MFSYNLLEDPTWPLKITLAIVLAYLIHQWLMETFFNDDDDPDGYV